MASTGTLPPFKTGFFINNEYVEPLSPNPTTFALYNPHDETPVHSAIPSASAADVDAAVAAATTAFHRNSPWRASFTAAQRAATLHRFADLITAHAADLAALETASMGQPAAVSGFMVQWAVDTFRYYAGWCDKIAGETFAEEEGTWRVVRYEPLGVCAGVGAWNASLSTFAWKVAPALAAGNTVIYKPSEKSPLGILALGELVKEAGFPPGVVQILVGGGETGALLASHMGIAKISFTGSAPTGRKIQDAANKSNMKRVTLELGGKSPAIVFEDANLENAVQYCSFGFLLNSGQVCAAASRTYVHESIAPQFTAALKQAFDALAAGMRDPSSVTNPMAHLGPLADRAQFDRVMAFIEKGKTEAELLTGGGRVGDKGLFVEPTIFVNPKPDAEIYKSEIFGPVSTVRTFKTEEEVIDLANDTTYGLSATLYTESVARAMRVAAKLETGTVGINSSFMPSNQTPFGGVKQSGNGRECGRQGLMAYLDTKTIHVNLNL